jgi:hypothetical protein
MQIEEDLAKEKERAQHSALSRAYAAAAGVTARSSTPEELRRLFVDDIAKWRAVIEKAGIEEYERGIDEGKAAAETAISVSTSERLASGILAAVVETRRAAEAAWSLCGM